MLTDQQRQEVDERIEFYFNRYLLEIFPQQQATILDGHNNDCRAHCGVTKKVDRLRTLLIGVAAGAAAVGGGTLAKFLNWF